MLHVCLAIEFQLLAAQLGDVLDPQIESTCTGHFNWSHVRGSTMLNGAPRC